MNLKNAHLQYESPITSGLKVMAKVKVFVHAPTWMLMATRTWALMLGL